MPCTPESEVMSLHVSVFEVDERVVDAPFALILMGVVGEAFDGVGLAAEDVAGVVEVARRGGRKYVAENERL